MRRRRPGGAVAVAWRALYVVGTLVNSALCDTRKCTCETLQGQNYAVKYRTLVSASVAVNDGLKRLRMACMDSGGNTGGDTETKKRPGRIRGAVASSVVAKPKKYQEW